MKCHTVVIQLLKIELFSFWNMDELSFDGQ